MSSENIDIRIREDGSRVVSRNLDEIANSSDRADSAIARLKKTLSQSFNASSLRDTVFSFNQLSNYVNNATHIQQKWNAAAKEAHALARGLSGSLGTLWMTYGSILPLLVGAALGSAFVHAAKAGSEFAYQLEFVRALGNESTESIKRLGDQALQLGRNGLYGPGEIAQGYRMLAQAGLDAEKSLKIMPDVLNLATVGEMSMEQAATTLVGVLNAFNLEIDQSAHVSDVFAKAAAISQTSVQSMTESMKYASVVGDQYKVSMEDTATALTLLAKNNITGTAAGTAFRNMVKEIYAPTNEASKVMEKLGLKAADSTGKLRPFSEVIYDLWTRLSKYNEISQVNILQKLFGERGAKEAVAMLRLTGKEWEELKTKISDSDGFAKSISDSLGETTKGKWKQALGTLEANFIETFQKLEPKFAGIADSLKNVFNSPEFASGVQAIVNGFVTVMQMAIDLAPALVQLGKAWLVLKAATLAYSAVQTIFALFAALRTAFMGVTLAIQTFSAVAAGAATTLAGGTGLAAALGLVVNPLAIILGLLAAGAAAWALWGNNAQMASGKAIQTANDKIKALQDEDKFGMGQLGQERQELERLQQIYDLRNRTRGLDAKHVEEARAAVTQQQKLVDLLEQREAKLKTITKVEIPGQTSPKTGLPSGGEQFVMPGKKDRGQVKDARTLFQEDLSSKLKQESISLSEKLLQLDIAQANQDIIAYDAIVKKNDITRQSLLTEREIVAAALERAKGMNDQVLIQKTTNDIQEIDEKLKKNSLQATLDLARANAEHVRTLNDYRKASQLMIEDMQFEQSIIGLTYTDVQKLTAARKIDQQVREQTMQMDKDGNWIPKVTQQQMESIKAVADAQKQATNVVIDAQNTFSYGWDQAYSKYVQDASNAAKAGESFFSKAISSTEDYLVDMATKGEASFSKMVNSMIADLIRLQYRAQMTGQSGPLSGIFNAVGGLFGMTGSSSSTIPSTSTVSSYTSPSTNWLGDTSGIKLGGSFDVGTDYVPHDMLALIHKGERITPAEFNPTAQELGQAPEVNVNINVKNEAGADGYQATATAKQNGAGIDVEVLVQKVLMKDLNNNGKYTQGLASTFNLRRNV